MACISPNPLPALVPVSGKNYISPVSLENSPPRLHLHLGFLEHLSFGFRGINIISSYYYYFKNVFIYLAVPGLTCSTWDLPSSLWHVGSLVGMRDLVP